MTDIGKVSDKQQRELLGCGHGKLVVPGTEIQEAELTGGIWKVNVGFDSSVDLGFCSLQ